MTTDNLGLPLISGNMANDVPRDMNALAEAVDIKAASAAEVATHMADNVKHIIPTERVRWNNSVNSVSNRARDDDPNTISEPYVLTRHLNCPEPNLYWHIHTSFYTASGNNSQTALSYSTAIAEFYVRHCFQGVWSPWEKMQKGIHVGANPPSNPRNGDIWIEV